MRLDKALQWARQQDIYRLPVNDDGMRGTALMAILAVLLLPASSAQTPIVPALVIALTPSTATVNSLPDANVTIMINGTVQVDKLPIVRIVVTLAPTVDRGFAATCDPSTIVVTDTLPHTFICYVDVPAQSPNGTAVLAVDGTGRGGGFTVTATAQSLINVRWYPPANWTGGPAGTNKTNATAGAGTNQTIPDANRSSSGGQFRIGPLDATSLGILVVAIAAAAAGAYLVRRRRRARPGPENAGVEQVEEVEAL